jgi:hypothetical protein
MWCKEKDKHITTYLCLPFEYVAKHQVLQLLRESSPVLNLAIAALKATLYQIGKATNSFKGWACWDLISILERQFWRSIAREALPNA